MLLSFFIVSFFFFSFSFSIFSFFSSSFFFFFFHFFFFFFPCGLNFLLSVYIAMFFLLFYFPIFFPFLRVGSSCLLGRGHSLISPVICHRLGTYLLQSRYTVPPSTAVRAVLVDRSGTGWLSVALRPQKPQAYQGRELRTATSTFTQLLISERNRTVPDNFPVHPARPSRQGPVAVP